MAMSRLSNAVVGLLVCCSAVQCCVVIELSDAGLASNVNTLWGSLPAYRGFNGSLFLDSWKFAYKCTETGGFHDFFVPEADFLQPWSPAMKQQHSCRYVEFPFVGELSNQHGIDWGNARYDPGIVKKVWRLQPDMQKEVDGMLTQLKSYPKPTIAFHVRGGDKPKEDAIVGRTTTRPVDLVHAYLQNFLHMRGGTCVLIGDDPTALEKMASLVKKYIGCEVAHGSSPKRREGHHQEAFNKQPLQDRCKGTKDLIKDIEIMAHADYFVGSMTSGLATLIDTLRLTLYDKPHATTADVTNYDLGHRLRVHWGIGSKTPVSLQSSKMTATQRRHLKL